MGSVSRRRDGDSLLPPPCGDAAISPATVTSDDWWRLDGPALGDGCAGRRKEIADGSTAAASSAGDTPAVSTADMTEEELKAMRAEKNRESARRSRAKIKEKVAAMEARLLDLSGENATLLALMESLMPEGRAPPSGDP